jgi:uncharacterized membrane protein (DUF2068 family)
MARASASRPGRRRHKVTWELVTCGLQGHSVVGTDAAEVRALDSALVREDQHGRWHRCLRCGSWLLLPVPGRTARPHPPPRTQLTIPLRGKGLRDKIVLRAIAIDRLVHFVVLGSLGLAVLVFASHESSLRTKFYRVLADIQGGVAGGPVQSSGHVGFLHELDKLFSLRSGTLRELGIALLAYGVLEGIEAVGLWHAKRWAEYLTFLATSLLLPLEVYELVKRQSALKIIGFLINLAVVVYLIYAKRLFGLRGGGAADERERARDMSWEAIERTAPPYQELASSSER